MIRVYIPDPDCYDTYEQYEKACEAWEDAMWDAADEKYDSRYDD